MSVVVVGSIAFDAVQTPSGKREESLGGSATYFSYAASFFTDVKLVGVVGRDFPEKHLKLLKKRNIDLQGLQVEPGKTFRWKGSYLKDLNEADTLETHLNVFQTFRPNLPSAYRNSDCVFLANIDPDLQMEVLDQIPHPRLVAADTMNLWIATKKPALKKLAPKLDILILNDAEAKQLSGKSGLIEAGRLIRSWGPKYVVIKKGEHGTLLFAEDFVLAAPAYPLEMVVDPTGAGDSFAGGFIGFLNKIGNHLEKPFLHQAMYLGTVMASYNVENFSLDRLIKLRWDEITKRLKELHSMVLTTS